MQNELLSCAIRAALLAGKDILNIYDDPKADFAIERKADNSPLTIADKRSHARIMDELDATSIPVLSEEGRLTDYDKRKGWKTLWVVDPLDGTKEFIKRNIAGEIVLVPSGQTAREFNGMVTLTETGEFIWEHIEEAESFNHLVLLILEEYEVDKDTASQDAAGFIMQLLQAGMISPTGINW